MIGTVDHIDRDGDRVERVVLRFPSRSGGETEVAVTTCERIGQGSFGTVYRAYSDAYPRLALKISTGKATRLKQELEVLSKVCTKGKLLLPRFEFGALNKAADIIVVGMELCVPCTLHDLLLSTKLVNESDMLFIAYQAVQAVADVHAESCIHRDIKLQNFVFDLDGNLKLIDFGLSCSTFNPPPGDVVAGTVSFMAPEMAHNALYKEKRVSVGAASDIWSLGIVLFSIFTQRNPYPTEGTRVHTGDSASSPSAGVGDVPSRAASVARKQNERLLKRVSEADWRWPADCPVPLELKALVDSILIKNPAQRPTIETILGRKLWNLRRRTPPAAVTAFLGVQDDFLLSRDEAHLMRAVEQRSAGVAASMTQSRVHSPERDEDGTELDLLATTPVREAGGSLKVVTRQDCHVGGAPVLQVYDVRASARKRSRPIREISQAIADETASTRLKSRRRGKSSAPASASRARSAAKKDLVSLVEDEEEPSGVTPPQAVTSSSGESTGNVSAANATTTATVQQGSAPSPSSEKRAASEDLVVSEEEVVSDSGPSPPQRGQSKKRPRDTSTHQPSSLILNGIAGRNGFLSPSVSVGRSAPPASQAKPAAAVGARRGTTSVKKTEPPPAIKKVAPTMEAVEAAASSRRLQLAEAMDALTREEAYFRKALAPFLHLEHKWLLASFRLTIQEDQERYAITWLGEEQEKSAAHPHKFKEMTQISSKTYQYGYICDMCDYEFIPGGKNGKMAHYYHCPCGRDLCLDCHSVYQKQCTCADCGVPHPNSCALRDHACKGKPAPASRKTTASKGKAAARQVSPPPAASPAKKKKGSPKKEQKKAEPVPPSSATLSKKKSVAAKSTAVQQQRTKMSITAMTQRATVDRLQEAPEAYEDAHDQLDRPVSIPDGPWRPFAKLRKEVTVAPTQTVTPEEREAFLHGEWIRYFYLYPEDTQLEPFAFVYHIQPGRTGAVFLTSEFQMHSAVFSMLERQFFVVDHVDTTEGDDITRATTLVKAKAHPALQNAFQALQEIASYSTNMMKQRRAPGTVSVYQAPRSAYSCNSGDPFVYVRWFRFNEDRTLSAVLLSNGAVQVFVKNEFELRWFDENRKVLVRPNGVCEMVGDSTFTLAPAINHLLYDTFES